MPFTNLYLCICLPYSYIKRAAATLETRPATHYASDTTGNINVIFSTVKSGLCFFGGWLEYISTNDATLQPREWPGAAIPVLIVIEMS